MSEDVQLSGHIIDSLLLPKVLDAIVTRGGSYDIREMKVGQRSSDPSQARITVKAPTQERLQEILDVIHAHGALPVHSTDCVLTPADVDGAFPEGFYCSTNFKTQIRVGGEWLDVQDQEMDCGIVVELAAKAARCVPMTDVRLGDQIVVGRQGVRVFPEEAVRRTDLFEFMSSPVSSEKPKGAPVREIAAARRSKAPRENPGRPRPGRRPHGAAVSGSAGSSATAT